MNFFDGFANGWRITTPRDESELRAALIYNYPTIVLPLFGGDLGLTDHILVTEADKILDCRFTYGPLTFRAGPELAKQLFKIESENFQISHARMRYGIPADLPSVPSNKGDCFQIGQTARNVIVYRNSMTWGLDEILASWYDALNIAIIENIIAEALHNPYGTGTTSLGALFGRNSGNHTVRGNLLAYNWGRNPRIKAAGGLADVYNNLVCWPGDHPMTVGAGSQANIWNNYLIPGDKAAQPEIRDRNYLVQFDRNCELWIDGNVAPDIPDFYEGRPNPKHGNAQESLVDNKIPSPINASDALPGLEVKDYVLSTAGARLPVLDDIDRRILENVALGQGRIIARESEVGGFLDLPISIGPNGGDRTFLWELFK